MRNVIVIICALLIIINGCGIFSGAENTSLAVSEKPDMDMPVSSMEKAIANFDVLTYNALINIATSGSDNSVNANIRIKRDSLIWISARKLGFEIGRLMISVDSVWLLDRINSQYFAGDFGFFSSKYNIDADYNLIESLFLGNPPENWSSDPVDIDCSDRSVCRIVYPSRYRINQGRDGRSRPEGSTVVRNELTVSREHGKLLKNSFEVIGEERKISAGYESFKNVQKMILPELVNILVINGNEEITLRILADGFSTEQGQSFPFRVPPNYRPIVIKQEK